MTTSVTTPRPGETCAYCGSRIFDHDPICVRDCARDCGSPTYYCNHACLAVAVEERGLAVGDACEWTPGDDCC